MRKPLLTAIFVSLLGVIVGWGVGSFLTYRKTIRAISSVPASPIIIGAKYDKAKNELLYSVYNPGTLPIKVFQESVVFTPGSKSKEAAYVISNIPVSVTLAPMAVTQVELKLKSGAESLKIGDVVAGTLYYTHPLSKDIYSVAHPFTYERG